MRRPQLSSRQRVILWVLGAVFVSFAVGGVTAVQIVENRLVASIDRDLRRNATELEEIVELLPDNPGTTPGQAPERLPDEDLATRAFLGWRSGAVILLGPDGPLVALPSGGETDPDPLPDVLDMSVDDLRARSDDVFDVGNLDGGEPRYRALAVPLPDGNVAVTASPLTSVDEAIDTVTDVLTTAALVIAAVLVTAVSWVTRRTLTPIEDMIGTAQAIGAGELDTRIGTRSSVPEVTRLVGALNAMLGRIQEAFADREASEAELRRFVADASHELRTPLAAVLGYAELYHTDIARSDQHIDHAMRRITLEATRMQDLVEELLLLARLDQRRPLDLAPADLAAVASDAVHDARAVDPDRTIELDRPATPTVVVGDPASLRRMLDNLVTNARVHTGPSTSIHVTVVADTTDPSDDPSGDAVEPTVTVTVTDKGPGMTHDDAAHAFDRFYRAERSRSRPGGSGLGLSIVAAIVHAHHGTVTLDTRLGHGTRVTVTLPAGTHPEPPDPGTPAWG